MTVQDLGSEFARAILGIVPASSLPEIVLSQFTLISWDHGKNPGFIWTLSGFSWQDLGEGKVASVDGFKISDYETVAVLRGGEILALVPGGSWVMKPEAETTAREASSGELELVWIDLRPMTIRDELADLQTETGHRHFNIEFSLRVADPAKFVDKFIIKNDKMGASIKDDVLEELFSLMNGVSSNSDLNDPSWQSRIAGESRARLEKSISDWGLLPTDLKIVEGPSATGSARHEQEGADIKEVTKVLKRATEVLKEIAPSPLAKAPSEVKLPPHRPERSQSDGELLHMLEWDTAPRRWIPSSMKGQLTCDGCGAHTETFAECRLSCRFLQKCRLCKRCYLQRNSCAFLVEVMEVPPKMADRFAQPPKADSEGKLGSTTVT